MLRETLGLDSNIALYFRDLRDFTVATKPEERVLIKAAQRRDQILAGLLNDNLSEAQRQEAVLAGLTARNVMVERNLKLVVGAAKKYYGRGLDFEDLIAEGNFGLFKAIEGFDLKSPYKFSTYAKGWIEAMIGRAAQKTGDLIRKPANVLQELAIYKRVNDLLEQELGRGPKREEIAQILGTSVERVEELETYALSPKSLQRKVTGDWDDPVCFEDLICSGISDSPECLDPSTSATGRAALGEEIARFLQRLNKNQARVVRLHEGFEDGIPHTHREIGDIMGFSHANSASIYQRALDILRRPSPELEGLKEWVL